jgi:signal transduction histidine kinase
LVIDSGLAGDDVAALREGVAFIGQLLGADRATLYAPNASGASLPIASYLLPTGAEPTAEGTESGSRCVVPVVFEGRAIGILELLADRADAFSETDRERAIAFAPILGAALGGARRHKAKDAFFALTIHELRTPLSAASGFALTILDHFAQMDREVTQDLLVRIVHNHRRLTRLLDDLVDLLRLEGRLLPVHISPVEVGSFLTELMRNADLDGREIAVEVAPNLPAVAADPGRLEQVISNLLANAAKFSSADSRIVIRALARDDTVDIQIVDEGEGIPAEQHEQIFESYYQGPTMSGRPPKGLGIGLFLVRRLCELMGASVDVDSAPGRGSTFTVHLRPHR